MMKKFIAILLSVLMIVGCAPMAMAAQDDLSLIVATDLHVLPKAATAPITKSTEENPFGHVVSNGKLVAESYAILDTFLQEAAQSDCDYILLTGDITDDGETPNVSAMAERLEAFEQSSGKTIIACIGNHETYHVSPTGSYMPHTGLNGPMFAEFYKNLGYDLALDVDEKSASYTVDLNSKYRLVCINSNDMSAELVQWIGQQAEKAKKDGKCLISATHFSLFPHYQLESFSSESVIDKSYALPDKFIDWGIKFNFSGHTHELDTAEYTNRKGIVYDITSGSLTTYPCNYKTAVFSGKKVKLDTKYIQKVNMSLVPQGLAPEAAALLESDFRTYARKMFYAGAQGQISSFIKADYIISQIHLNPETDRDIMNLIRVLVPKVREALDMPLYGENSLSALAKKNGFRIPKSDYNTLFEAIVDVYCAHCAGNEDCSVYTPAGKAALNGVAAALAYALDTLSKEDYLMVINWALDAFSLPVNISDNLRGLAANILSGRDDIAYILLNIVSPVLDDFLKDKKPDDATVTLPGYGRNEVVTATFTASFAKILNYIRLIFNAVFSLIFR